MQSPGHHESWLAPKNSVVYGIENRYSNWMWLKKSSHKQKDSVRGNSVLKVSLGIVSAQYFISRNLVLRAHFNKPALFVKFMRQSWSVMLKCVWFFFNTYSVDIVHSVDNHTSRSKDGGKPFSCDAGVCYTVHRRLWTGERNPIMSKSDNLI